MPFVCAKRDRDVALVWRLVHVLGRRSRGPKKRRHNIPDADKPLVHVWRDFLAAPASQGGLGASLFEDLEAELAEALVDRDVAPLPPEDQNDRVRAVQDVKDVAWHFRHCAKKRRGCPPWSVPAEVWHLLRMPNMRRQTATGLGGKLAVLHAPLRDRLEEVFPTCGELALHL